ncbi:MAG TPA: DUF2946 family protein [Rhizomicrobium sp.]
MQGIFRAARSFALVAILLRALLPAGWMPDAQAGLTICSLGVVHHDSAPGHPAPDGQSQHEECPFAAAPHLAATPDVPHLALPAFHAFAAATDRAYASAVAARFSPQSPRAPPLNA